MVEDKDTEGAGGRVLHTNNSCDPPIILQDSERQPCETWTRVMGYFRPVENFNVGKKQEFAERKYFSLAKAMEHIV